MLSFKKYLVEAKKRIVTSNESSVHPRHFVDDVDMNNLSREEYTQGKYFEAFIDYFPAGKVSTINETTDSISPTKNMITAVDGKRLIAPGHIARGGKTVRGMDEINEDRAKVYGSEHRPPLSMGQMASLHKDTLEEHFSKPVQEQIAAEKEALGRLRQAGHISSGANTLDEGEKTDTVHHEEDEHGRNFIAMSTKGIAGHTYYTSGSGEDAKHHIVNTCAGQTKGCGGGLTEDGVIDTSKGTCFAPKSEAQYPGAAVRRHAQTQAMLDPKMSKDWILAHAGSLRGFANKADKQGKRALFRPNVLNEMDNHSSRTVLFHLNRQRASSGLPSVISNSYGKMNELHDPENDTYITHSNIGPKVKPQPGEEGHAEVKENIRRDRTRVLGTVLSQDKSGKPLRNPQGNMTPAKNSYAVISAKRGSDVDKQYQKYTKAVKYWGTGTEVSKLSDHERSQSHEAHYDGEGQLTTPDKAHYGHRTVTDEKTGKSYRFSYQMQHVLHPRLVAVGKNKDGSDHMIPSDSRFLDHRHLPAEDAKERFKGPHGRAVGAMNMTTPTHSTSNDQHHSSFTHHVDEGTIAEIRSNGGVHEIDKPEHQVAAMGREYVPPSARKTTTKKKAGGGFSISIRE